MLVAFPSANVGTAPGMVPTPHLRRENHGSHPWPVPASYCDQDRAVDQDRSSQVGAGSSPSNRLGLSPDGAA